MIASTTGLVIGGSLLLGPVSVILLTIAYARIVKNGWRPGNGR